MKLSIRGGTTVRLILIPLLWCIATALGGESRAQSLSDDLKAVLKRSDKVAAAQFQLEAAKQAKSASYKGYYPTISTSNKYGREWVNYPTSDDTEMTGSTVYIAANQTIYDFGVTSATVDFSELSVMRASESLSRTEQDELNTAITAYIQLANSARQVVFADLSVKNITLQTKVETAKVSSGAGYQTDVLQAKAQLSGAQARLVRAEGTLDQNRAAYVASFRKDPDQLLMSGFAVPKLTSPSIIPKVEESKILLRKANPRLKIAAIERDLSEKRIDFTRASGLFPTLSMEASKQWLDNRNGLEGLEVDNTLNLKLVYSLDAGLTGLNKVGEAVANQKAAQKNYDDLLITLDQELTVAWSRYSTAKRNSELLNNQAELSSKFLELARNERTVGKRSLLDVLAGETTYITAISEAAAADMELLLSQIAVLRLIGKLSPGVIE